MGGLGLQPPSSVIQEECKTKKGAERARGTLKVAVLKGDSKSCDLVVVSNYDQKPFYMITHSIPEVTWVVCEKMIHSSLLGKKTVFRFLRCNVSNDYNYEMNDNDVADQMRLVYRIQRFQRNYKWWWALWIWMLEVSIVNSYMLCKGYCEIMGFRMQDSHHDFREKIGRAFLEPTTWPSRNRKAPPSAATKRTTPPKPPKAPRFSKQALSPNGGRLAKRLDMSLCHMPVPMKGSGSMYCQLHKWAAKEKGSVRYPAGGQSQLMHCEACRVNLCVTCWKMYHSCRDLDKKVDTILSVKK